MYAYTYITQGWLRDYYNNTGGSKDNKVSNLGFAFCTDELRVDAKCFCSAENTTHPPRLEITYSTSFPINNMSFTYDPSRFNDENGLRFRTNCYAYAMRIIAENTGSENSYGLQPGELSNTPLSTPYTLNGIYQAVSADLAALGFQIQQTTASASVPSGWRKIAIAIDADSDFHFYVRHSDGTWSHKMGSDVARNLDANGVIIYDSNIETISNNYSKYENYSDGTMYVLINKGAILDFVNTTSSSPSIKTSERAGDTFIHSKPVSVGSTTSAKFDYGIENFQDVDFYKIVISTAGNYSFYTTGDTDTVGQLFSSTGTRLAYNDDNYDVNCRIDYNNLAAGTYFVKIHPYHLSNYGSYSFVVTKN
uniref:pre-peptidase C-terminal domain-containing protein n=1 Tax=Acetivibrio cellulolyticus TaxID=35830 RepID=UPI0001E2C736|nr:pre-peptidase C-terminal domain-containing protein [Acetivibrio cellulolyticus]